MVNNPNSHAAFEADVTRRFGILPNFFRSARAAPELLEELWGFAKAGYLDNPMPSVFKERLFVWLSRFCPMRYCIVRHVGFLLGEGHGQAAGDESARPQSLDEVITLLRRPSPWKRDMTLVYASLETARLARWVNVTMNSLVGVLPSFAPHTIGRCFIRRSNRKRTCWHSCVATRSLRD